MALKRTWFLGQAVCNREAGRASTHDHVVVLAEKLICTRYNVTAE